MNCDELKSKLREMNVPEHAYSIQGLKYPNEAYCLVHEGQLWKYYYSERGCRSGLKEFVSESEACKYFYGEIKKSYRHK